VQRNLGHRELLPSVSGRRGLIVCWLDGGGNSDVGRDWCGWVSGTLCALGSHLSFCTCRYPTSCVNFTVIFTVSGNSVLVY